MFVVSFFLSLVFNIHRFDGLLGILLNFFFDLQHLVKIIDTGSNGDREGVGISGGFEHGSFGRKNLGDDAVGPNWLLSTFVIILLLSLIIRQQINSPWTFSDKFTLIYCHQSTKYKKYFLGSRLSYYNKPLSNYLF